MGVEIRRGRAYYYVKERIRGKSVSRYVGRADSRLAALCAGLDECRAERRQIVRHRRSELDRVSKGLAERERRIQGQVSDALSKAGFYRHRRQWRRRGRGLSAKALPVSTEALRISASGWQRREAVSVIVGRLESYSPEAREKAVLVVDAILRDIEARESELLAECTTGLEKALVGQIMDAQAVLVAATEAYQRTVFGSRHEAAVGEYLDRLADSAQRRFLRAVESLVRVRRLLNLPMVVNVSTGLQQVNVGVSRGE